MLRRRGNPNWSKGGAALSPLRCLATKFENEMRRLGLTKETCAASHELRRWCERNKDDCYIPEWLLETFGISVHSISTE